MNKTSPKPISCVGCAFPPNLFLTQIVNGKTIMASLCAECRHLLEVTQSAGFNLVWMVLNQSPEEQIQEIPNECCGACGFTTANFKKSGMLGCAHCYSVFFYSLETILPEMHRGVRHHGKAPARLRMQGDIEQRRSEITAQLEGAIAIEDFEAAARLRDELQTLLDSISATQSQ